MQIKFNLKQVQRFVFRFVRFRFDQALNLNQFQMLINLKNVTIVLFAHRNIKRGIEKKCHKMPKLLAALWFCVQIFHVLTLVSFSSLRRLLSSISTGDRDRYFSRSAGDTELRCKYIFNIKFLNNKKSLHSFRYYQSFF